MTFNSLKAGALTILPKPEGINHPNHKASVEHFISMVKTMAEVKVIRRVPTPRIIKTEVQINKDKENEVSIIAIGASAGGPPVLQEILTGLKSQFNIPILIVQHVDPSFADNLCFWLRDTTRRNVVIANENDIVKPSTIYMAPSDCHFTVTDGERILISRDVPEHSCRPSVSYLFRGISKQYGKYALGIILTGMGTDGANELKVMHDQGCQTIVQDPSSVLVNGMPGEAIRLKAVSQIMSPPEITKYLNSLNST
jgi:two-component system chemotaxis response regulator CheB